jgi:hypothetical protein
VSGAFEGDLIRPLGLVTLNFGYAEYELDLFLERLASAELLPQSWARRPIGQKLGLLTKAIRSFGPSIQSRHDELLLQAQVLVERRNALIHGCLLAGGRVVSGRTGVAEQRTSVEDLNELADAAFAWKEQLWSYRWRQIEPLLTDPLVNGKPNQPIERKPPRSTPRRRSPAR